jgi:hypothetical protein
MIASASWSQLFQLQTIADIYGNGDTTEYFTLVRNKAICRALNLAHFRGFDLSFENLRAPSL